MAVDDISFMVDRGEVLGFLGPNAAGKSTTMRMITGFLPPTSGTAVIGGSDVIDDSLKARQKIGYLPENAPTYPEMTVLGFLEFIAGIRGFSGGEKKERIEKTIERCFLREVRFQPISTLSKGFNQRVCFAQSILHDPEYLIMDEPTDGLDPNQKPRSACDDPRNGQRKDDYSVHPHSGGGGGHCVPGPSLFQREKSWRTTPLGGSKRNHPFMGPSVLRSPKPMARIPFFSWKGSPK